MKIKTRKNGLSLVVHAQSTRSEELIFSEAENLKKESYGCFLTFLYFPSKKGYSLHYSAGTAHSLKGVLSNPVDTATVQAIFDSFLTLIQKCEDRQLSLQRINFFYDYIFFDSNANQLRFMYVPFHNALTQYFSLLDTLRFLSEKAVGSNSQAENLLAKVRTYVKENSIFSAENFKKVVHGLDDASTRQLSDVSHAHDLPKTHYEKRLTYGYDFVASQMKEYLNQ